MGSIAKGIPKMIKASRDTARQVLGPHHEHVMKCECALASIPGNGRSLSEKPDDARFNMATIRGLKNRADLNGRRVKVANYNADTGRYTAYISQDNQEDETLAVRPDNLILDKGVKVVLRGLVSANDLNGKHGEVVAFRHKVGRYAVKISDESEREIYSCSLP